MYLVFTTGYPNQKEQGSRVLSSSSKVLAFSREVQIPWQRRETAGESSPFNRTTFNGQIIMLPSYGQSTTAIYASSLSRGYSSWKPRVWPLLSSGPHICLVTSSYIRILILSGLRKRYFNTNKNKKNMHK